MILNIELASLIILIIGWNLSHKPDKTWAKERKKENPNITKRELYDLWEKECKRQKEEDERLYDLWEKESKRQREEYERKQAEYNRKQEEIKAQRRQAEYKRKEEEYKQRELERNILLSVVLAPFKWVYTCIKVIITLPYFLLSKMTDKKDKK
jgi:ferric-dicitrate binding protein FerR (iron transport regulator)